MNRERIERLKDEAPATNYFLLVGLAGLVIAYLCRGI